ncbi:MAG: diacylglycerol kinase [Alphaproteobacteria bacterium]|nr:MAG: diacylglycerol kinase [Alphaproteobacteria bacterium]
MESHLILPRISRITKAIGYSIEGLKATFQTERAFQEEVLLSIILMPLAFYLAPNFTELVLLLLPLAILLIVEIINSAIEATVNLATNQIHPLAKKAKDAGSAAVLLSLIWLAFTWIAFLLKYDVL